jgi:hypothetical protein
VIADLTFAAGFLALCAGLGLPIIAALPPGRWPAAALAAPPLGLALLAIAVTALYRHGVAPATTLAVAAPCAAAGLALGARRAWRAGRAARACAGGAVLAAAVVALACLAPRWTGGPAFAVCQGNHFDQLNYLAYAAAFRRFGYDEIRGLGDAAFVTNASLHYIAHHLDGRPAAMAVYAALAEAAGRGTAAASHAYVATLQALMFFAAAFALVAVFRVGPARAFVAAAAIAVGFPMQYVVDINAWSQLAAMPLALAALAMLAILLERPTGGAPPERRTARLASVAACGVLAGGLMYLYPEIAAAYGPAAAPRRGAVRRPTPAPPRRPGWSPASRIRPARSARCGRSWDSRSVPIRAGGAISSASCWATTSTASRPLRRPHGRPDR